MNFRATVQDGLIIVNTHGTLPDGTPVDISVSKRPRAGKSRARATKAPIPRSRHTPGYGMWADRAELGSSNGAVDRLRSLTRRRRVG